ncbi:enterotoxin [Paraburkholderia acidipaludis]|uniref:enterotoxin n=1 Tax=Paraburkholderia acidipaludis TaxID=660537 RepID=UPI000B06EFED|nr:enterotoxin [Paraburkholderia acidipaludis]
MQTDDGAALAAPGVAGFDQDGDEFAFGNAAVALTWRVANGRAGTFALIDRAHGRTVPLVAAFQLTFADGATVGFTDLDLLDGFHAAPLAADAHATRQEARKPGLRVSATLADAARRVQIEWHAEQRDGEAWLRMSLEIMALSSDESLAMLTMLHAEAPHARACGVHAGVPVVADDLYLGVESPLAQAETAGAGTRFTLRRALPLLRGKRIALSAVVGVARAGQLRRDFARYLETTRARPYEPFLHYNSWYDIGYLTPYTQVEALDRIAAVGRELHERRGVRIDSFLFDDGWDDLGGAWRFSAAFPEGFVPLRDAAAGFGAAPGVWLSPWGGYCEPRETRVAHGRALGYETVGDGFALSGPRYYARFREVVMDLLERQGVNHFKLDGTGNADCVVPGSAFDSDWDAAIHLIQAIRAARPATFVNLSTGTVPSPFWLRHVDSVWRGGADNGEAGVGNARERWITYRDAQTWHNVVRASPLFPLNSLMLHGVIFAQRNARLNRREGEAFRHEVRSYFASGTQLQELYITPALLDADDWDALAAAARWSRSQAQVLRDSQWVGGVPDALEVYGWAAWAAPVAIVALRNPHERAQTFVLDLRRELALPAGASSRFAVRDPWGSHVGDLPAQLDADRPQVMRLAPFEVRVLELQALPHTG